MSPQELSIFGVVHEDYLRNLKLAGDLALATLFWGQIFLVYRPYCE